MDLKQYIRIIEDFPKPGIVFKDITPLMQNGPAYHYATTKFVEFAKTLKVDLVVGPEARGFVFGCPVAYELSIGFIPVRKPGKLPAETVDVSYSLEYGSNTLSMHEDAIKPGERVLIIDDLLATGGTLEATIKLVEKLGGIVAGVIVLIELEDLKGREHLPGYSIMSLVKY